MRPAEQRNNKIQLLQLQSSLAAEFSIYCDECGLGKTSNLDLDDAAEYFFEKGWRVSPTGDVKCPKCNAHE